MLLKLKLTKSCVISTTTKSSLSIGNQVAIDDVAASEDGVFLGFLHPVKASQTLQTSFWPVGDWVFNQPISTQQHNNSRQKSRQLQSETLA